MVYLDTNILIYLFENHPAYGEAVARLITDLKEKHSYCCATLTVTECLSQVTDISIATFQSMPNLALVPLDEFIATDAARLQRETKLRIGDAIHLATALSQKSDMLLTNDKPFAKIAKQYLSVQTLEVTA